MNKILCEIFKSPNREGMYLYVLKQQGLSQVPEALLKLFGKPKSALTLMLDANRKLANADIDKVLAGLDEQGYYLQMPVEQDQDMKAVSEQNSKLPRA